MVVETFYTEPGAPREAGFAESFHSKSGDELVGMEEFETRPAALTLTACFQDDDNSW